MALFVVFRQQRQVSLEVLGDLFFGLGQETEADTITCQPRECTYNKGPAIPQDAETTRAMAKLPHAVVAPEQVTVFLVGRRMEFDAQLLIPGDERLTTIKGLGGYFSRMIDSHESCGFCSFGSRKSRVRFLGHCILVPG